MYKYVIFFFGLDQKNQENICIYISQLTQWTKTINTSDI